LLFEFLLDGTRGNQPDQARLAKQSQFTVSCDFPRTVPVSTVTLSEKDQNAYRIDSPPIELVSTSMFGFGLKPKLPRRPVPEIDFLKE